MLKNICLLLFFHSLALAQSWSLVGSPKYYRNSGETSVNLGNGSVLIFGGRTAGSPWQYQSTAELYNASSKTFSNTGNINYVREYATGTLLNNGKVLICGGGESLSNPPYTYVYKSVAELYDPVLGTFTATGSMNYPRSAHSAVKLSDGKVLIIGGGDLNGSGIIAEIYDPANGQFSIASALQFPRRGGQTATLLQSGKVLVVGGSGGYYYDEVYDPITNTFSLVSNPSIVSQRVSHTATLLDDGRVLIVDGYGIYNGSGGVVNSVEIYQPSTNTLAGIAGLAYARQQHAAIKLTNGKVLVCFGFNGPLQRLKTEIFDPSSNIFRLSSDSLIYRSFRESDNIHLLPDGSVFSSGYAGTVVKAEIYQ